MNVSRNILSCDALFLVTSPKTSNVSLFIILVRQQKLISRSILVWLTFGTKGFSHPKPYCSLNYITTLFYEHPCRHETWARCWSSVDPPSTMLAQRWTGVVHMSRPCLASVVDAGTTLRQRWFNLLCLPDIRCTGQVLVLSYTGRTPAQCFL